MRSLPMGFAVLAALVAMGCVPPAWAALEAGQLRIGATVGASVPYQHHSSDLVYGGWMDYSIAPAWALSAEVRHSTFESTFDDFQTELNYVVLGIRAQGRSADSWHPYLGLGAGGYFSSQSSRESAGDTAAYGISGSAGFHHDIGQRLQWGIEAGFCGPTGFGGDMLVSAVGRISWLLQRGR